MAVTAAMAAVAVTVDASPGALQSLIDSPAGITELTVAGAVDARDLFFIADEMPALKSLDLSAASIEAYEGAALRQLVHYNENELPAGVFAGSPLELVALGPGRLTIGDAAFAGSQLRGISVPADCVLGMGAFAGCGNLVSATVGAATVPDGAFAGCGRLAEVSAPAAVEIGASAFRNCAMLGKFEASPGLRTIGADAFSGCSALTAFDFPATLTAIGASAFSGSGLSEVDLGGCAALTAIGGYAFSKCAALRSARLPASLERLDSGLFFDCSSLSAVELPAACAAIGSYALKGCGPSWLELPGATGYIGDYAMAGMERLSDIYAHRVASVPELGENVWAGVDSPSVSLHVLDILYSDFSAAGQWQEFALVKVASADNIELSPRRQLRGRFRGNMLELDFGGLATREAAVYDVSGMRLAAVGTEGLESLTADSSAWPGKVFVVSVTLADGKTVSLKLGRN